MYFSFFPDINLYPANKTRLNCIIHHSEHQVYIVPHHLAVKNSGHCGQVTQDHKCKNVVLQQVEKSHKVSELTH